MTGQNPVMLMLSQNLPELQAVTMEGAWIGSTKTYLQPNMGTSRNVSRETDSLRAVCRTGDLSLTGREGALRFARSFARVVEDSLWPVLESQPLDSLIGQLFLNMTEHN